MKKYLLLGVLIFLLAFTVACTPATPVPPTPTANPVPGIYIGIQNPADGSILALGPTLVVAEANPYNPSDCCVTSMSLLVNGHSVLTSSVASGVHTVNFHWTPPRPGQYYLQALARTSSGHAPLSQAIRVCVLNGSNFNNSIGGYLGPCATPTRMPSAPSTGAVSFNAILSPDPFTIFPSGCPSNNTFTINAYVTDPSDQAFLVVGNIAFNGNSGYSFYLNWVSTDPGGQKYFHGVYTPLGFEGVTSITWQIAVLDRRGNMLTESRIHPVGILEGACPHLESGTAAPLQIIPSATPANPIANVQAYPSPIYYGNTCPSVSSLSFRAALMLPPGMDPNTVQVLAHVNLDDSNGNPAGSLSVPLMSNGTFDTASGGQVFLGSLDLSHSYNDANNQFDPASLDGANGSLHWYITVANQNTEMGRSSDQTLNLAPCPTYAKPTAQPSGNTCNLSAGYCQNLGKKLDTASCSCVP